MTLNYRIPHISSPEKDPAFQKLLYGFVAVSAAASVLLVLLAHVDLVHILTATLV